MAYFPDEGTSGRATRRSFSFGGGQVFLQRFDLEADCLDVCIDTCFHPEASAALVHLLAAPIEAIALQIAISCVSWSIFSCLALSSLSRLARLCERRRLSVLRKLLRPAIELARQLHGLRCCHICNDFKTLFRGFLHNARIFASRS